MKQRMCIFYVGVDYDHSDISGNGDCLDALDANGNITPCRKTIIAGNCSKKRLTPLLE